MSERRFIGPRNAASLEFRTGEKSIGIDNAQRDFPAFVGRCRNGMGQFVFDGDLVIDKRYGHLTLRAGYKRAEVNVLFYRTPTDFTSIIPWYDPQLLGLLLRCAVVGHVDKSHFDGITAEIFILPKQAGKLFFGVNIFTGNISTNKRLQRNRLLVASGIIERRAGCIVQ